VALLNINSDAAVSFTNKLEKMHRSALPVAVRGALNNVAFDVKKKTMPFMAKESFTERRKNFFRATSRVQLAKGFNLKSMKSKIGFVGAEKNQAVDDLNQQERGGSIGGRSFIPMNTARISNSEKKLVRKKNRTSVIRNIDRVQSKKMFFKTVVKAGVGGHIIYKDTLFRIKSIKRGNIKLLPLYSYSKNRSVRVKPTLFMQKASKLSRSKIDTFYKEQAERQFKKFRK